MVASVTLCTCVCVHVHTCICMHECCVCMNVYVRVCVCMRVLYVCVSDSLHCNAYLTHAYCVLNITLVMQNKDIVCFLCYIPYHTQNNRAKVSYSAQYNHVSML